MRDKSSPDNTTKALGILKLGLSNDNHPNSEALILTLQQMLRECNQHCKAKAFLLTAIQSNPTPKIIMQYV
jgi:hypothetical protein